MWSRLSDLRVSLLLVLVICVAGVAVPITLALIMIEDVLGARQDGWYDMPRRKKVAAAYQYIKWHWSWDELAWKLPAITVGMFVAGMTVTFLLISLVVGVMTVIGA